jgi:hypothetical protein
MGRINQVPAQPNARREDVPPAPACGGLPIAEIGGSAIGELCGRTEEAAMIG